MVHQKLMAMFDCLLNHFGPQHWWPARTAFEVMVGAILTQNTNWGNVEKAIANLKEENLLSPGALASLSQSALAERIRPSGYYNVKAARLKNLIRFLMENYGGDIDNLLKEGTRDLRKGLLSVKGVGPETADSILLYAADRPVFVIDAYTYRILTRHNMIYDQATYDDMQALFMDHLPEDVSLFNEFHALIVMAGKDFCRKKKRCTGCPLESW